VVARCLSTAMILNLVFECGGLRIHFAHHPGKGACEHPRLAARIDRDGGRAVAAGALDSGRQLDNWPGQRPCDEHGQPGRAQHRDQSDQQG